LQARPGQRVPRRQPRLVGRGRIADLYGVHDLDCLRGQEVKKSGSQEVKNVRRPRRVPRVVLNPCSQAEAGAHGLRTTRGTRNSIRTLRVPGASVNSAGIRDECPEKERRKGRRMTSTGPVRQGNPPTTAGQEVKNVRRLARPSVLDLDGRVQDTHGPRKGHGHAPRSGSQEVKKSRSQECSSSGKSALS
jgi:hypothetical protein